MKNTYDIIVIGAGISGLTFANAAALKGKKVLVLEAEPNAGGCLHTAYHSDKTAWVELGAHTFYNKYTKLINLLERLGLKDDVVPRKNIPLRVFSHRVEKVFPNVSKLEFLFSFFHIFTSSKKDKTVEQYFGSIVGKNNYKRVFNRLLNAVAVQRSDKFTAEYFLKSRKTKNKAYPKSFILRDGMNSLISALADAENITLRTNFKAVQCKKTDGFFEVQSENNETAAARNICFAATSEVNGHLLKDINSKLSRLLLEFPMQGIDSKAMFVPQEQSSLEPMTFLIPLEGRCLSMVTRDVMPHHSYRGFTFHFEQEETNQQQHIDKMLGEEKQPVKEDNITRHKLPLLKTGHAGRMAEIKALAKASGIYLVGNFFNGLSLEDCVERALEEAEDF